MTALESDPIIRRRKSRVARYVIAAVVVAVLGVTGYYLWKYSAPTRAPTTRRSTATSTP